jgi:glycosyltransferase involved in cell wall biosynthesis
MILGPADRHAMAGSCAEESHPGLESIDLTAFVSCHDEARYIVQTLDDICRALHDVDLSFEIIVVDDCSTDDSFDVLQEYVADHPEERITVVRNRSNRGLAQNYIDAAFMGRGKYYKLFCGDNTEPPESIAQICRLVGSADMIIPSYSTVEGKSRLRQWLSKSYTWLVNRVSGHRLRYYNGLAVHLRRNIMRWHPNTRGFGFQADIICMLLDHGASYREVTVPAINRSPSRALSIKNMLSVGHTLTDILVRRLANWFYGKSGPCQVDVVRLSQSPNCNTCGRPYSKDWRDAAPVPGEKAQRTSLRRRGDKSRSTRSG